ncbi:RimK family alpha-L-glutamate ligase [Kineococcus gynurae]|uniref:RimK family alpha-L-glutamate ligase n=1 Tax=Kineococcus gynurae TaxID=452979 RepID=A0ABV5LVI7_9ACTN
MATVWLLAAETMPKPEADAGLLAAALAARGATVREVAWTGPASPPAEDWAVADLVVVRTPWDYVAAPERFLARLGEIAARTTVLNDPALVAWNAHKRYLLDLAAAGVALPATAVVARGAGASERSAAVAGLAGRGVREVVVKPATGVGGHGALRRRLDDVEPDLAAASRTQDVLLQEFEPRVLSEGEVSLVLVDGEVAQAVRKSPAAGEFRVHDHFGGRVELVEPTAAQRLLATRVLDALPAAGGVPGTPPLYARVDLLGAEDPVLVEVELIEPELFLRCSEAVTARLADAVLARLVPAGVAR